MSARFYPGANLSLFLYDTLNHLRIGVRSLGSPCRSHPEIPVTSFPQYFAHLAGLSGSYTLFGSKNPGSFRLERVTDVFTSEHISAGICLSEFAVTASKLKSDDWKQNQGLPDRFGVYVKSNGERETIDGPFSITWNGSCDPIIFNEPLAISCQPDSPASSISTLSLSTLTERLAGWVRAHRPYSGQSPEGRH